MRKIISLLMAITMIITAVSALTITASANATWGGEGSSSWWDESYEVSSGIDYVEALYFENEPTIDGYVTEAEWGKRTVEMYSADLGTTSEPEPLYNSFFYWKSGSAETNPMQAMIWLRWDENYYYVAALVRDFDGHSLKHGRDEAWNGDALQFRVDPDGANSATGGEDYDPNIGTPWADKTKIPDFLVGYVQIAGGFVECFESTNDKGLTAYSKPVFGEVKVAVAPSEQNSDNPLNYHDDAKAGYTTYEIAIPWKYIYEVDLLPNYSTLTEAEKQPYTLEYSEYSLPSGRPGKPGYNPGNEKGGIGQTLGMSLTVLNAEKGGNSYKSFISWGSGITSVQTEVAPQTCAGSNEVKLSAEKVQQGSYSKYDPSKLNASVANKKYDEVFYDYLAEDLDRTNPISNASSLKVLTYDSVDDLGYWGSEDLYSGSIINVGGAHGNVLNYDRVVKTHTDNDGKVHEAGVDPIDQFYIDTQIIADSYEGAGDGLAWRFPISYTIEFDVMYTGLETVQEGRVSELGNLFGGAAAEYYCGYSFADKKFVVRSFADPSDVIAQSATYDLKKDTWYNWKFQYDNDTCTVRLLINDEVIFNINNRYFYYFNEKDLTEGTLLCWWFINTQMKMDNVKVYNFYDYVHKSSTNVEGGVAEKPPVIQQGGDKVEVGKDQVVESTDGTLSIPVITKPDYKTVTELKYTFSFDTEKFDFQGIVGLEEKDYKLEQAADGSYTLTITNVAKVKAAATGATLFEIVVKGKNGATKDDLFNAEKGIEIKDSYKYASAPTGDNMIYVAVIAAVMLAGCAVVVSKKQRSF